MSNTIEDILDSYSIEQLNSLIQRAQEKIELKKVDEIQTIRNAWLEKASILGMSPEEILQFSGRKRRPGKPKYRNPDQPDQTWTGRGKKPFWLKNAPDPEACRIPE